jgi:hypothetical protein
MSMREIIDTIDASTRREKHRAEELQVELKLYAGLLYRHAQLVAVATWDGRKYPTIERAFPGLMKQDDDESTEAIPLWKRQQAGMAAWVAAYNERVKRKKVSDDGGSGTN